MYKIIDLNNWERSKIFDHFINEKRSVMNLNVDVDITELLAFCKKKNLKFYPIMMWIASTVINRHDEFKYGFNADGKLILWDSVSPFYSDFHKEDKNFVKLVNAYNKKLEVFYDNFIKIKQSSQNLRGFELENIPENIFEVSCLPWVRYNSFDISFFDDGKNLSPIVVWGKFENIGQKAIMPMTLIVNHAVADGYHLSNFFVEVQQIINEINNS